MIDPLRPTRTAFFALIAAFCFPLPEAQAQADFTSGSQIQIIRPGHPIWLIEQPYADNALLTASTHGDSAYGEFHAKANLHISCHPQSSAAVLQLQIAPESLGFDSNPYEGPDATSNGPLRMTVGARTTDLGVTGFFTAHGAFQLGTTFAFSTFIPSDDLAYLASDASRGQPLKLALNPATPGGKRLTATFSLPENNDGLKTVIQSCLGMD